MITLTDLTKRYGSTLAVDRLSFRIKPGLVTGFLGPNGAGKSTTMRMIVGLDRPTGGQVAIDGSRYDRIAEPLRRVGAMLDAQGTHGGRSARDHLRWLAQSNRIPAKRVEEVLEKVGIAEVADRRTRGFSLGMSQRLGIAAALLGDPPILLLDEPVNGLDPEGVRWIRTLMRDLAEEGRTIFVSSHLMSEMAITADHLVVIGRGRLLADTSMAEFIDANARSWIRIRSPQPERLLDTLAGAGITARRDDDGTFEVEGGDTERVGDVLAEGGVTLHELSPRHASLEEAFIRMTEDSVEYSGEGTAT